MDFRIEIEQAGAGRGITYGSIIQTLHYITYLYGLHPLHFSLRDAFQFLENAIFLILYRRIVSLAAAKSAVRICNL